MQQAVDVASESKSVRLRLRLAELLSVAVFVVFATVVLLSSVARPVSNWDMLAYEAAALERSGVADARELHRRAYEAVKARTPAADFTQLTTSDDFRATWAADPDAFRSLLPMYQVKGGYVALLSLAGSFVDRIDFARWLSRISVAVILGAIAFAFWRCGALASLAFAIPVLAALNLRDMASLMTPDAPATALVVVALAGLARPGQVRLSPLGAICVALSVALRPDMIVVAVGLPAALAAAAVASRARSEWLPAILSPWPMLAAVGGVACYLAAKAGVAHPGWWPHFWFSIVGQQASMAGFSPEFSLAAYAGGVARAVLRMLRDEIWPWLALTALPAALAVARLQRMGEGALALILTGCGMLAVRLVIFPLGDARLAVLPMTAFVLAAALLMAQQTRPSAAAGTARVSA
jgi:hypothetical protein